MQLRIKTGRKIDSNVMIDVADQVGVTEEAPVMALVDMADMVGTVDAETTGLVKKK